MGTDANDANICANLFVIIDTLDAQDAFSKKNAAKTLKNKCGALQKQIDNGSYSSAINKLNNDFLSKTDGCSSQGSPDSSDWVNTCGNEVVDFTNADGQNEFEAVINASIWYVQLLQ